MKLTRTIALLLLSTLITLGSFSPLSLAEVISPININTATAVELAEAINGVGEVRAAAIIALREQLGGFANLEQLLDVKGISDVTLSRISSIIVLE
ncbi:MAG: ComEA family DNA-binding protein [Pseudomonadales bacterium]